ncbi:DUF6896 domain-containing protein [Providencia huaxiensis]|uniref:DUF6896 domain-containing protein n=1 Tax=Providencia huaxiensis TaxID=2027290 RepID=UPI0034E5FE06
MDSRLRDLINDYLKRVSEAMELMKLSGFELPISNNAWAGNSIPQSGELHSGIRYFKHGYGCAVHLRTGTIDFDFGEHGEFNGFDFWRLSGFAKDNLSQYGFQTPDELKQCFDAEITKSNLLYSGYILYYLNEQQ